MSNAATSLFATYEPREREALMALRDLILKVAATTPGVGQIEETLKWGQPSFLTPQTRSGTTIRLGGSGADNEVALFVHCQTTLIEEFRQTFSDTLRFEGNRAILVDCDQDLPTEALGHCIAQALTYHSRKKQRVRAAD